MTTIATSTPHPGIAPATLEDQVDSARETGPQATFGEPMEGEHPFAKFGPNDLHPLARPFTGFGPEFGGMGQPRGPQGDPYGATRLYDTQGPAGSQGPQLAAPPAKPGKPMELGQLESLNTIAKRFNVDASAATRDPVVADDLRAAKQHFQAATDALKAGDYKKAEQELRALGFPLPRDTAMGMLPARLQATAIVLGILQVQPKGKDAFTVSGNAQWGARGNQALNDLNGFAANAIMINRMAAAPAGVSNPPTEAQATGYMRNFAQPAQGKAPTAQEVMQAASEITHGMIMHYSSARRPNPEYDRNPQPHAFYKDGAGQVHEFNSLAEARKAVHDGKPPIESGGKITPLASRSPDAWSDISSPGQRAGRYIGDCESKVYLQTRLLTEAGFTSLGSVDVQHGNNGHMFGVFKAPDGSIWLTSNEEFKQVKASDPSKGVTQADLDGAMRNMTAELYHIEPNFKGEIDLSDFKFAAAATGGGSNAAVDSIRRSAEMNIMGRSDTLIPPHQPPAPKP